MKLVRRDLEPDGPGSIKIIPEEDDDMWHAYNLISEGDLVQAVTVRKVLRELASGGRDSERVKLKLEIKVESVDYNKEGSVLRIRGKNVLQNEHVKIGQFHTLEVEPHRPFVLRKDVWDSFSLDILHQACDPAASADLAVVLMQEDPANDHGFIYDDLGKVDIIKSPFFDFSPGVDQSVEEYVERIIFQLAATIDEQISSVQWLVGGNTQKSTNVKNLPMQTSSSRDEDFQEEEN
ncbi:hypothetical protein M5K25_010706 [Dendrobium thyrsiflorum]|uniref:eRF1/Pelota-like N-terminal domain-containing protein n=1 Tax=Dendrobium thyrsiflorum TaxID=117978 RepID=A0ABD0V1X6_DENTH